MLDVRVIRQYKKDYPYELKAINKVFLYKAAERVLSEAQALAPRDNGDLILSLKGKVQLLKDRAIVGTNLYYAPYQEYGTVKMAAQPYLRPALDKNRRWLVTEWKQLFRKTFRTLGKL